MESSRKVRSDYFSLLPIEVIFLILANLGPKELFKMAIVSRLFCRLASEDVLWRPFLPSPYVSSLKSNYIKTHFLFPAATRFHQVKQYANQIEVDNSAACCVLARYDQVLSQAVEKSSFFSRKKVVALYQSLPLSLIKQIHAEINEQLSALDQYNRVVSGLRPLYDKLIDMLHQHKEAAAIVKYPEILKMLLAFIQRREGSIHYKSNILCDIVAKKKYQCGSELVSIVRFAIKWLSDPKNSEELSLLKEKGQSLANNLIVKALNGESNITSKKRAS
jgi:hypothetical protein